MNGEAQQWSLKPSSHVRENIKGGIIQRGTL